MSRIEHDPYRNVADAPPPGGEDADGGAAADDGPTPPPPERDPDRTAPGSNTDTRPTDTPAPSPDPDRDADLAPVATTPRLGATGRLLVHAVFWSLYGPLLPLHATARFLLRSLTRGGRLRALGRGLTHLTFFANRARGTLYLRASWLPTPATVLPFMPGSRPVPEDPTVSREAETPEATRKAVLRRDGYVCQNCAAGGGPHGETELHVDHAVPVSRGGSDRESNLRTLCRACHEARHARRFR